MRCSNSFSVKSTFIYSNKNAYRVVSPKYEHHDFIKKFEILYSSSANITKNSFDKQYALKNCDLFIENHQGYNETFPSHIFKINKTKLSRLR